MKKIIITLILLLFLGCSRTIMIKSSPSDLVLLTLQANNNVHIVSQVNYMIDEPYIINHGVNKDTLPIKKAVINQYKNFFISKYPKQKTGDADYSVTVILNNLDFTIENMMTDFQTASVFLEGGMVNRGRDVYYNCTLTSTVEVKKKKSIDTLNVVAISEENVTILDNNQERKAIQETLEDCISKSIILTSRRLDAIIK